MKKENSNALNIVISILLMLIVNNIVLGQSINPVKKDSLLNYSITVLEQGEIKNVVLGDLTKELNILYFWSTYCAPCLRKLPVLDSLQQVFFKDLALIPISGGKRERVTQVITNNEKLKDLIFKVVVEDVKLKEIFPHRGVPHVVWLDREMNVLAITDEKALDGGIIQQMIVNRKSDILDVFSKANNK